MANYLYAPLKESHIRLIKVELNGQDKLQASIEHAELDEEDPIPYSALSYVWGDANDTVQLSCNGKNLKITSSLHKCLRQVSEFNPNKLLWVDQICINQDDLSERSEQVKMMNTIYYKAETVIAWLGPESSSTHKGLNMISRVAAVAMPKLTDMFRVEEYPDDREGLEKHEKISVQESKDLGISFEDEESWAALVDFFDRPWFQRIWIVQEILPARKAIMLCGAHSIDWNEIQAAARWHYYKGAKIPWKHEPKVNGINLTVGMNLPWCARSGSEFLPQLLGQKTRPVYKWPLRRLLEGFRPRMATEPKDKVYALLGISEVGVEYSSDDIDFTVDYTQSVKDVFALATRVMIARGDVGDDDLDIIMAARRRNRQENWPSWVPDWRLETGYGCAWGIGHPLPASWQGRSNRNGRQQMFKTGSDYTLGVEGVILGRATYVSEHEHLGPLLMKNGFFQCHEACLNTLHSYPTGESVEQAFALTMMTGELPKDIVEKNMSVETYSEKHLEWVRALLLPRDTEEQRKARDEVIRRLFQMGFTNDWLESLLKAYCERRFYTTNTGYMGLGNQNMESGDVVAILFGMKVPCVLRPRGQISENGYEFIGEAYCHGMMEGEAVKDLEKDEDGRIRGGQRIILH
ncbi:heterokaryon incompatibility protein-domain-containing protein [Thelonectria olida]|uniref:Heterokaryon incompatibility protein-domain-containing protein n=1 Tax=Thelonectria olida TaxID=1576542 RepID=A0A9P9AK41_9HYPO|nr:heterokaryon incompatibility protein-domain-containing protein [Thelonectria olida]